MSDNLFDNFIKDKLQNHSAPVAEGMFERIQSARERERRVGFWWNNSRNVGLGVLVVALITTIIFTSQNITSKENSPITVINNKASETSKSNIPAGKNIEPNSSDSPLASNGNDDQQASNGRNDNANIVGSTDGPISEAGTSNNKKTATINNTIDRKQFSKASLSKANSKNIRSAKSGEGEIVSSKAIKRNYRNIASTGNEMASTKTQLNTTVFNAGKRKSSKNNLSKTELPNSIIDNDVIIPSANALTWLANRSNALSENQFKKTLSSQFKAIVDCPSAADRVKSDWYAEVFFAPDYAIKSTKNNGLNDEYIRRKDSTEKYNGAFTAGLRISKTFGDHFMLKSGLQYSQVNEKFKYQSENERRQITIVTVHTIIRSTGDTIIVRDTSNVEQIGYRTRSSNNKYSSLDIPVILGYEWGNDNFRTSINGGVILNLQSWQKGEMLDTSYQAVAFDKSGSQVFKHNVGLSLYGGVSFLKRLGERMEVFAEPYFRYSLSNMTNSNSPFNQKINIAGINLGIRYKITNRGQR
jgi:hypothetical protein